MKITNLNEYYRFEIIFLFSNIEIENVQTHLLNIIYILISFIRKYFLKLNKYFSYWTK